MTTIPMEPGPVDAFMQAHPARGTLRIQVTAGPFPVAGAQVEVFRRFGQLRQVFYRGVTDQSGILQGIALPALPAAWLRRSVWCFPRLSSFRCWRALSRRLPTSRG